MSALAAMVAEFEHGRVIVDGLRAHLSQTGEPYVEVLLGGPREIEGSPDTILATSEEAALRLLLDSLRRYAAGKSGAVYWRVRPEIDRTTYIPEEASDLSATARGYERVTFWRGYARLLITDKPVIYPDLAALDAVLYGARDRRAAWRSR